MKRSPSVSIVVPLLLLTGAAGADDKSALELARKGPHTGPAAEAVVGIEVVDEPARFSADGSKVEGTKPAVRRSSGLLVRCDGFIIAPSAVFGISRRPAELLRRVRVTLNPGTDRARRVVTAAPGRIVPGVGYAILKLKDFHAPAARLRQPDGLKPGDALFAFWTDWDDAAGTFGPPQHAQIQVAEVAASVVPMGSARISHALSPGAGGACLATPDGVAVGIAPLVVGTAFSTFAPFGLMSNSVVPSPGNGAPLLPGDAPEKTSSEPLTDSAMVAIPGGPVLLPRSIAQDQPDMGGAAWACVAPFEMDKYEVTNNEYLDFWYSLPESMRNSRKIRDAYFPMGWAPSGEPFPQKLGKLPVLGVSYSGAEAYARWKGKRLPTPYEWCLAAMGPDGDTKMPRWAQEFVATCSGAWDQVSKAHIARRIPPILANVDQESSIMAREQDVIPWFFWARTPHAVQESDWSKGQVMSAFLGLMEMWKRPKHAVAVGSRSYDISPYGVMDAVLNAAEIVTPYPTGKIEPPATVYVNVDWVYTPYFGTSAWVPLTPKGRWWGSLQNTWTYTNTPPLLSRYVGFTGRPPTKPGHYRSLIVDSTFYEISDLVRPIDTWRVSYVKWTTSAWGFVAELTDNTTHLPIPIDQAASYPLWAGVPKWFEPEMGRPIALPEDAMTERLGQVFQGDFASDRAERWLAPGGFRCVR